MNIMLEKMMKRMIHQNKKRNNRLIVLLLCGVMFFSGCNSIIVNGDLSFKAYEPVAPMKAEEGIKKIVFGGVDMEKYGIEGMNAFFMLPNHLNPMYVNAESEDPIPAEFKVLDYVEETGNLIYAYFVPYFLSKEELEKVKQEAAEKEAEGKETSDEEKADSMPVKQAPNGISMTGINIETTGNAENVELPSPEGTEFTGDYVMVLMSYNPSKHNYNVFYCKYVSSDDYDKLMPSLIAGKVGGKEDYFIYYNNVVTIFNKYGKVLSNNNYSAAISQKCREEAYKSYGIQFYFNTRFTITNVDVDSKYVAYITVQIETSDKRLDVADKETVELLEEDTEIDETKEVENSKNYEEIAGVKYLYVTFACFALDVGEDSGVKFISSLEEGKIEELKKIASEEITITPSEEDIKKIREKIKAQKTTDAMSKYNTSVKEQNEEYQKKVKEAAEKKETAPVSPTPIPTPVVNDPTDDEVWEVLKNQKDTYLKGLPNADDTETIEKDYYKKSDVLDIMNNNFSKFDTSGMAKEGLDLNISLAGVRNGEPDLELDGNKYPFPLDIRHILDLDERWSVNDLWKEYYEKKYLLVEYSSFLAARKPYSSKGFLTVDEVAEWHMMSTLSGNYYTFIFGNYGEKIRYAFLTPGEFTNTKIYSWRDDDIEVINQSPLYKIEEIADSTTGYYNVGKKDDDQKKKFNSVFTKTYPAILAYMETNYNDGNEEINYCTFDIDVTRGDDNNLALPKMVVHSSEKVDVSRKYTLSWNGNEIELVSINGGKVDIPTAYRMVFPKGTIMYLGGNTWMNDYVKASEDMGAIVYHPGPRRWWKIWGEEGRWDDLSASKKYIDLRDKQQYCEISQGKNNEKGLIWDQYALGEAVTDVGSYTVKDGSSGTYGVVTFYTDKLMRFYSNKGRKKYKCYMEMSYEKLKKANGYGLVVNEEATTSELKGTDKISQNAISDETPELLMSHNMLPYSETQFFLYNDDNGVRLLNLIPETSAIRVLSLLNGHYYAIIPTKNYGKFLLVGFQTEKYSYTDIDIAMAKMYLLDLGSIARAKSGENINSYIDELRDYYHSVTHTIRTKKVKGSDEVTYEIVKPSNSDKNYKRAVNLFSDDSNTTREKELTAICKEYGITLTDSIKEYAENVAEKISRQRKALKNYYELIGIKMKDYGIPDTWQYLKREGEVFSASYKEYLEIVLVEMVLSDDYVNKEVTHMISNEKMLGMTDTGTVLDEYSQYRKEYKEWLESRAELEISMDGKEDSSGNIESAIIDLYKEISDMEINESITQMEFYKLVLNDIKKKYEDGLDKDNEDALTWDENLEALFKDISPEYGTDPFAAMKKNGLDLFYAISGLPKMDGASEVLSWKEEELIEELSECRYDYQIEEIIIKYTLKLGIYHEKLKWHDSWNDYINGNYKDEEEKVNCLRNSECYDIIRMRKDAVLAMALGKGWDEAINNVLIDVGNGISRLKIEMGEEN